MIELTERVEMAYAEGMDDAINGDNLNPYDSVTQPGEFQSYEQGFLDGLFADGSNNHTNN